MSDIGFGLCKLQIRANISARFSPHSTPNHNRSLIKTLKNILIDNTPTSEVHLTSAVLSSLKKQYGSKLKKGEPNVMVKYNKDYFMTSERAIIIKPICFSLIYIYARRLKNCPSRIIRSTSVFLN